MQFRVLGAVGLTTPDGPVDLGPPRQRSLLGLLLLDLGSAVPVDRLVDLLWDGDLPDRPRGAVQVYVSRLRRRLQAAQAARAGFGLRTRAGSYLLEGDPDRVDALRMGALTRQAMAAHDPAARLDLAREALALWQGPPLGPLASSAVRRQVWPGYEELRAGAQRLRLAGELAQGAEHVLADLAALTARHPLDEPLGRLHLLALFRAGRRQEALAAYHRLRARLAEELGLDPGAALQDLYTAMLRDDPDLHGPVPDVLQPAAPGAERVGTPPAAEDRVAGPRTGIGAAPVPALLPPAISDFVGRRAVVASLRRLADAAGATGPRLVVLTGPPGVGKTALAVRAATDLRPRFPSGQLYASLGGAASSDGYPVEEAAVLGRFLRALGHPAAAVPADVAERRDLYRSVSADRRILVLLDDAADEAQVRPLVPTGAGSLVLVTSRRRLSGLAGAQLTEVPPLPPEEAEQLLTRVLGARRAAGDREAVARIGELSGGLPLALRVAGAHLASAPRTPLADFARELADERGRLDLLQAGDQAVRSSFALSYQGLDPQSRRLFRRLGLLAAPTFPDWVAPTLLDLAPGPAGSALRRLERAGMVQAAGPGSDGRTRFAVHELLRVFARELSARTDPLAERSAQERTVQAWVALAEHADRLLGEGFLPVVHPGPPCAPPERVDRAVVAADPLAWVDLERANLVAAVRQAVQLDRTDLAWHLAAAVASALEIRGRLEEWRAMHTCALEACERAGDVLGEAVMLKGLADLELVADRYEDSIDLLHRSTERFGSAGAPEGVVDNLCSLAVCHRVAGRLGDARRHANAGLELADGIGYPSGRLYGHYQLGIVNRDEGEPGRAIAHLRIAHGLSVRAGRRWAQAVVLRGLGALHGRAGELELAVRRLHEARAAFAGLHDEYREALTVRELADAYLHQGRLDEAAALLEACWPSFTARGDRFGQALTLHSRADLAARRGRPDRAEDLYRGAADLWRQLHVPLWEARTLRDLGALLAAGRRPARARAPWLRARALFGRLGLPDAAALTDALAALERGAGPPGPAPASPA